MTYDEIKNAWNAQADDGNRWHSLSEAEKIEWAAIHAAAKERTARQAAQAEVAELKGRIARAGVEQRRALHKALQQERDAEEGKVVRGEMADELLATVGQAQAVPCAIVRAVALVQVAPCVRLVSEKENLRGNEPEGRDFLHRKP